MKSFVILNLLCFVVAIRGYTNDEIADGVEGLKTAFKNMPMPRTFFSVNVVGDLKIPTINNDTVVKKALKIADTVIYWLKVLDADSEELKMSVNGSLNDAIDKISSTWIVAAENARNDIKSNEGDIAARVDKMTAWNTKMVEFWGDANSDDDLEAIFDEIAKYKPVMKGALGLKSVSAFSLVAVAVATLLISGI